MSPGPVGSEVLYDLDPEVIVAAVLTCPAVAAMSGGPLGAAATYLPGRSVSGVRLVEDRVEVHITLAYRATVSECAAQVRHALLGLVGGRPVDIVVQDVVVQDVVVRDVFVRDVAGPDDVAAPRSAPGPAAPVHHPVPEG